MIDKTTNDQPSNQRRSHFAWTVLVFVILSLVIVTLQGLSLTRAPQPERGVAWARPGDDDDLPRHRSTASPSAVSASLVPVTAPLATPLPWTGDGPVNILFLGVDSADWDSADRAGPPRSDTLIFLTIDPERKTAGLLSIPRDLWVDIPGTENGNKINAAYRFGEIYHLPGGGPSLAVRTVEGLLGVPIHYYVRVDFASFVRLIDAIGGVKLNIPEKITIDLRGTGGKTKKTLQPGVQTLPGEWALAYARARHTKGGDFDRIQRQIEVIQAARTRILDLEMLPGLIQKAPELYLSLRAGVQTNLTLDRIARLAWLAHEIPSKNIRTLSIGSRDVVSITMDDGQQAIRPVPERIHALVVSLFLNSMGPIPDLRARMQLEDARIALVDATGQPGAAQRVAGYFEGQGLQVVRITQDPVISRQTRVLDHTGKLYSVRYLATLLGMMWDAIQVAPQPEGSEPVDLTLILGTDWARRPLPTPRP